MAKNTDQNTVLPKSKKPAWTNLILWKPGQSGNPQGRPKGQRDYRTLYRIAMERIAEAQGMDPDHIEEIMHAAGITKALKGDFFFYKDINDRIHGKPKDTIDLGTGGKTLFELIATANAKPSGAKRSAKAPRKNKKRT